MSVLNVRGLSASYPGASERYVYPDIIVGEGECVGIVGKTGCGKSTLLNSLFQRGFPGIVFYDRAEVAGESLGDMAHAEFYKRVSYMPQFAQSALNPSITVRLHIDHVVQDARGVGENIWRAWMQELGLSTDILGLYPRQLSGGMKQRLVLLLGCLKKPLLYAMDEPSNAVDAVTMRFMAEFLERRKGEGMALVIVSHDEGFVRFLADSVIVLGASAVEVGR